MTHRTENAASLSIKTLQPAYLSQFLLPAAKEEKPGGDAVGGLEIVEMASVQACDADGIYVGVLTNEYGVLQASWSGCLVGIQTCLEDLQHTLA